ncbi:UNVERIFIED_CONTAM: UDP-glycosyltransferase 74E2 [Sesamum radiatum]|uniref:anthocyanidin 3-O-glucoside 5-O-glucosyltransferase n=1 Tax=Sesamum radiatum TaxID=300843 RepID=A0AAW2L079_SESRA
MEKGEENPQKKAHCLIFPYPIQGHINPMLQFAKRLLQKGDGPGGGAVLHAVLRRGPDLLPCVQGGVEGSAVRRGDFDSRLPPLKPEDMPSFMYVLGSYPPLFEMVVNQFSGLENADWLFLNTFYKLEEEVIDYMSKFLPVKTIGPTVPSMYLDKRLPDDKEYGLNVYKPDTAACMEWLNQQQPETVVYVSFGSLAQLGEEQMEELAWGLRLSNKHFLWVVRSSEEPKLPKDFAQESSEQGLIVSWSPQLDVLAHEAVCCFVTHCGWNSTLEALSLGVPMVAVPQWTDQGTNSKFVMDVWKMGVRAKTDDKGIVSRETIASCIRDVMEGERGDEIKKNAIKWKELAREAVDEGGSSDKNIEELYLVLVPIACQAPLRKMSN